MAVFKWTQETASDELRTLIEQVNSPAARRMGDEHSAKAEGYAATRACGEDWTAPSYYSGDSCWTQAQLGKSDESKDGLWVERTMIKRAARPLKTVVRSQSATGEE